MSTQKNSIDTRSAKQREKEKSAQEHAEDIAYTVNHALSCGATDILVQPIAATAASAMVTQELMPKWLRWTTSMFEHHHDGKTTMVDTGSGVLTPEGGFFHKHIQTVRDTETASVRWARVGKKIREQMRPGPFMHNLGHWAVGETAGDAGGIIPTIMVQRFFPSFMDGMRKLLEPVARPFFRNGAERDARRWGKRNGFAADAPEVEEKRAYLYEHEISHLPQAMVWNAFSIPINFGVQYLTHGHHKSSNWRKSVADMLPGFIVGKGFGTLFSNGVLLGGRAVAPDAFIAWDRWNSKHIIKPVLEGPGKLLGIDKKTADHVIESAEKERGHDWQSRVKAEPMAEAEPAR